MDRVRTVTGSERARATRGPADEFVLPSRAEAISGLASALDTRDGPVLLTGDAGVGKSWVCRRLTEVMPASWRWAAIDLSPAIDAGGCLRLLLHALGHDTAGGPADMRAALRDILAEGADDGRPWGLIVEEAHNASPGVLEELRVLGNRSATPEGFAATVLVGQNALGRRLATRQLASFQARLSLRVHLRPLDVEELRAWVTRLAHGRSWDVETVERLHRETSGNPRKVVVVTGSRPYHGAAAVGSSPGPVPPPRSVTLARTEPTPVARIPDCETPPVAPGRPPLRFEEGMIEVGWEPTSASADGEPPSQTRPSANAPAVIGADDAPEGESSAGSGAVEVIDDHYAALQAWTEWAQNQGREPSMVESTTADGLPMLSEDRSDRTDPEHDPSERLSGLAGVRAEGHHDFAPYSQLFTKLRQPHDSNH